MFFQDGIISGIILNLLNHIIFIICCIYKHIYAYFISFVVVHLKTSFSAPFWHILTIFNRLRGPHPLFLPWMSKLPNLSAKAWNSADLLMMKAANA
jgi:hypothetical protein